MTTQKIGSRSVDFESIRNGFSRTLKLVCHGSEVPLRFSFEVEGVAQRSRVREHMFDVAKQLRAAGWQLSEPGEDLLIEAALTELRRKA